MPTLPGEILWYRAATAYLMAGNEHEAMFYLKVAVMIEPLNADINYQIGLIYQHRNDTNRAMYYYTEALKLKPDFTEVYKNIIVIALLNRENVKDSLNYMETCLTLQAAMPFNAEVCLQLCKIYKNIEDTDRLEYYNLKLAGSSQFAADFAGSIAI